MDNYCNYDPYRYPYPPPSSPSTNQGPQSSQPPSPYPHPIHHPYNTSYPIAIPPPPSPCYPPPHPSPLPYPPPPRYAYPHYPPSPSSYPPYPSYPYPDPPPRRPPLLQLQGSFHRPDPTPTGTTGHPIEPHIADMTLSQPPPPVTPPPSRPAFHHSHSPSAPPSFDWSQNSSQSASFGRSQVVPYQPSRTSLKVLLLHGNLDIWIYWAKNLPNMDMFSKTIGDMLGLNPRLTDSQSQRHLCDQHHFHHNHHHHHSPTMTSDPYVSFSITTAVLGRTYVISNSENPVWNQHFHVPVAHYAAEVHFVVKDSDVVGSQLIGTVTIPVEQIYGGEKLEGVYPILGSNGKQCKPGATLMLSILYAPIEKLSSYHRGVGGGLEYVGVPGTYFPLRRGGRVKLYQDAHVPDRCLPELCMEQNMCYEHGQCWRDITKAIREARRLIYVTGWSVYHQVQLVRDDANGSNCVLGDLLKCKSQEGVRVLLLVWDDPTSRNILGYQKDGIMATHDEETRKFFKNSSVHVLLCPRSAGKRHSWMKQQEVGIIYTHHQKTVIVDSDAGNNKRKMVAFLGGLDLCDGRYDTPHHPLFRTLHTLHKDDYHNPTFLATDVAGPREPWHDLHSRIDGPAAYDVLKNFEERWMKASKPRGIKKLKRPFDDSLLKLDRMPDILSIDESPYFNDYDPENWHVQIFRSIDSNSVKGFPKNPAEATSKNLVCGKNVLIDMSIHTAYVKAIRAAQHFIYIENQYFLGSSYNWSSHKDLGANNLIPMEIALKIANKIRANEPFCTYVVVPMWPEGIPTGVATQRILFWQHKTMQMMYETIYKALVEVGLENVYEPQDYLSFFCLGNREAPYGSYSFGNLATTNSPSAVLAQKNRRFMIYVHSKGMIVDDEYIILGSANINQRSLEGTRDSEIAMGAYQPQHTWARKQYGPRGQIYAFRMSLWVEHIGALEECFANPGSFDCMRRVRSLGELYWLQFTADEVIEMRGHLLKYPVAIDRRGKVKPLPGFEAFPDVGGNICGSFMAVQENLTI